MKPIFLKFCLYIFCMFYDIKTHHLLRYVSHKDDESYQEKTKAPLSFCRSLKVSKLSTGFIGDHDDVLGAACKRTQSALVLLFWQLQCEDVRLLCAFLPSWLPHKHFEALDLKIMFLANSVHLGFWNISWTYSPPPKKLFLWKIAFVCRAGPFILSDAMGMYNITFAVPRERSGLVLRLTI